MGPGHDRFLVPPVPDAAIAGGEGPVVERMLAAMAASINAVRSRRLPGRVRPERCLPALSWLPGQRPAQLAACCLWRREAAERIRLERAWAAARRRQPQLVMVWGRRRVGKTFLLRHFIRGKRAVFLGATQQAEAVELGRLAEAVRRDLGDRPADLAGGAFASWEAALRRSPPLSLEERSRPTGSPDA